MLCILASCVTTREYEIVDRRVVNNVNIDDTYRHELEYIKMRRKAAGFDLEGFPLKKDVIGDYKTGIMFIGDAIKE